MSISEEIQSIASYSEDIVYYGCPFASLPTVAKVIYDSTQPGRRLEILRASKREGDLEGKFGYDCFIEVYEKLFKNGDTGVVFWCRGEPSVDERAKGFAYRGSKGIAHLMPQLVGARIIEEDFRSPIRADDEDENEKVRYKNSVQASIDLFTDPQMPGGVPVGQLEHAVRDAISICLQE